MAMLHSELANKDLYQVGRIKLWLPGLQEVKEDPLSTTSILELHSKPANKSLYQVGEIKL